MTIQEVKNQIESNVNLIGELINEEIDLTIGNYTRLILEYIVPLNPNENTVASFLAHGIDGDYTLDKSYDSYINMFKNRDFISDTEDYLNSLRSSNSIISWTELLTDAMNPEIVYSKVYVEEGELAVPKPWILVRSGSEGVSHSLTTWDQFPIPEDD